MSKWPKYPVLLEINTWVWLQEISQEEGHPVTLGNMPRAELDRLANYGVDGIWLMGVWQRSPCGRDYDRKNPELLERCQEILADFTHDDIPGSPYAIYRYQVDPALGGAKELDRLREQLRQRDLRFMLDFVPNHFGCSNSWLEEYPERFIRGNPESLHNHPDRYFSAHGQVFAHGRDRYFTWPDTVQLDYRRHATRRRMRKILLDIAKHCDGVRCDMAMLETHEVFCDIWGDEFDPPGTEFWPTAINKVKAKYPDFLMIAEVYWNMEYALQRQGFDYTYDKRLYDRLVANDATQVLEHLYGGDSKFQSHLLRFLENHDEKRAMESFGTTRSKAVATIALLLPGMRLVYEGQLKGTQTTLPVQLGRRPVEPFDPDIASFYSRLLTALRDPIFHDGAWQLLNPQAEWHGNPSYHNFVAYRWTSGKERRLAVVNLSPTASQCFLPLNMPELAGHICFLDDVLGNAHYERDGDDLLTGGLYLNLPGYGYHLFTLQLKSKM